MKVPYRLKKLLLTVYSPFLRTHTADCGHETKRTGLLVSSNGHMIMTLPVSDEGTIEYCLDCISDMTTKCPFCNAPIYIGNYVLVRNEEIVACRHCVEIPTDCNAMWMPPGVAVPANLPFGPVPV
jgi:hypothetical protein